jgi:hypothetical protein
MIERQIAKPIPKPSGFVVKKESNSFLLALGGNPSPVSQTVASTALLALIDV